MQKIKGGGGVFVSKMIGFIRDRKLWTHINNAT